MKESLILLVVFKKQPCKKSKKIQFKCQNGLKESWRDFSSRELTFI